MNITSELDLNSVLTFPYYMWQDVKLESNIFMRYVHEFELLLKKINLPHSHLEIKPSLIHGLGLFATTLLPSHNIITFLSFSCPFF